MHHFISLSKTIHVNLSTSEGFWDFITRQTIILIIIWLFKAPLEISYHTYCLFPSQHFGPLGQPLWLLLKIMQSSCHLKFCMSKTKLIICTPLDPLHKPVSSGISSFQLMETPPFLLSWIEIFVSSSNSPLQHLPPKNHSQILSVLPGDVFHACPGLRHGTGPYLFCLWITARFFWPLCL